MQLEQDWLKIPAVGGFSGPPCPLDYSAEEVESQERDQEKWLDGLLLMKELLSCLGDAESGWVKHEDYDDLKKALGQLREQFLDQMASGEEERAQWDAVWPFKE